MCRFLGYFFSFAILFHTPFSHAYTKEEALEKTYFFWENQIKEAKTFWTPKLEEILQVSLDYWWKHAPNEMGYLKRLPPTPKKLLDKYISWSLNGLNKNKKILAPGLPEGIAEAINNLSEAMNPTTDQVFQSRLDRLLKKLIPFTADPGMQDCYRVIGLDTDMINAFNTGCTVYVTKATAKILSDDELSAVLSHELSHGDYGHALKNMGYYVSISGGHIKDLLAEEIKWLMTGKIDPLLEKVIDKGNIPPILATFSEKGVEIELEADAMGVKLLKRAKLDKNLLKMALIKMSGYENESEVPKDMEDQDGVRDYPSIYRRMLAIDHAE